MDVAPRYSGCPIKRYDASYVSRFQRQSRDIHGRSACRHLRRTLRRSAELPRSEHRLRTGYAPLAPSSRRPRPPLRAPGVAHCGAVRYIAATHGTLRARTSRRHFKSARIGRVVMKRDGGAAGRPLRTHPLPRQHGVPFRSPMLRLWRILPRESPSFRAKFPSSAPLARQWSRGYRRAPARSFAERRFFSTAAATAVRSRPLGGRARRS